MNGVGPQDRQALFQSIESEIESMPEMFVVICEFVDELQDSEVSEASIALFLTELKKIGHSLKDAIATTVILRGIMQDSSSGSSQ